MSPARKAGLCSQSVTSIDTSLAGTNRSGTHRRLPELAGSETAASNTSSAGGTADCQVAAGGGERQPADHQVVETNQLSGNSEQVRTMDAAGAAGGEGEVQIIEPSPTDFNPNGGGNAFIRAVEQAYHCRVLISKLIAKGDAKIEELGILEAEREEGESEDEEFLELQKDLLKGVMLTCKRNLRI